MSRGLKTTLAAGLNLALVLVGGAGAETGARDLDVAFVLDTTGSMAEEIREAKERIRQLSLALREARPGAMVRFGVVAYRDRGDAYVTRISPLGPDVEESLRFLAGLRAEAGGDAPEDVLAALAAALDELDWKAAEADRQIVLIGDAPPHLDYRDGPRPEDLWRRARERRIVVNTIGCRSLSADGVEFFRSAAYATEGSYQHIGRVESGAPPAGEGARSSELAAAVLKALATTGDDEAPGEPLTASLNDAREGGGRDLWVEHVPAAGGRSCGFVLHVPAGLQLGADPQVTRGAAGLRVVLKLVPGQGEQRRYQLADCVPLSTPIHLSFTEAR